MTTWDDIKAGAFCRWKRAATIITPEEKGWLRTMSINRVIISGNLTREPELRSTSAGLPVMQVNVAVNDRRKNQQTKQWEDYPNFVDCTLFGTRAEQIAKYLNKGSKVAVEGKLRWSQWEKDGTKRSKIEVVAEEIEFMSKHDKQEAPVLLDENIPF